MNDFMRRAVQAQLDAHLEVMPVVVVTGARQTGKSASTKRR